MQPNTKFTTASLGCFLRLPLTKHNLAFASLLCRLQMNASLYFPTIKKQQDRLAQLYDLQFEAMPQLFGKELIISYLANFVEPIELLDPEYSYREIVETLALIIQHPSFDPTLLDFSKRQLLADYQELMEEPANYAIDRFFKLWYQDAPDYAENFIGPVSEIKSATTDAMKLFSASLRTIPTTIVGLAHNPQSFKRLAIQEFKQAGLMKEFACEEVTIPAPRLLLDKTEEKDNLQSQLMIGYGYEQKVDFYGQVIGMLLAQYLAGDPSSKLFEKIIEELGAAYAVEANNYANNSLFLINAGLQPDKADEAEKIIREEMNSLARGQIDLALFKKAKKALLNGQLIGRDQSNWQLAQMLRTELFPGYVQFDREDAIRRITPKQMQRFTQNLFLNESYLLK